MTDHPQSKIEEALSQQFGIKNVTLHYGLTQDELFYAAIENDNCLLYTSPSPRD